MWNVIYQMDHCIESYQIAQIYLSQTPNIDLTYDSGPQTSAWAPFYVKLMSTPPITYYPGFLGFYHWTLNHSIAAYIWLHQSFDHVMLVFGFLPAT